MKTRSISRNPELVLLFVLSLPLLFYPPSSSAQELKATTIGDFGHVTVMEVTGNYDARNPDGSVNSIARQEIAKEFFRTHRDAYDFLVIFSNFDFQMPDPEAKAIYHPIKNDVSGIGIPIFDHSSLFGSNGKLQGIIDMGNISALVTDPMDPQFEETLTILSHEQMHRWGAYVKFREGDGRMNTSLLGRDGKHWSYLLDSSASVLYGHKWQSNGDGTFTSIDARKYYSPLDLYLMGFYGSSQVPPMLLIDNPAIDPSGLPQIGVTISGTPRYIEIKDIIDAEGPRIPDSLESQKTFKTAFILITLPNTFRGDEVYGLENIRKGWTSLFSILTDGQGLLHVVSLPEEVTPANPGIPKPPVTPRTAPPDIEDGVRWLVNQQRSDGSWMDLLETAERDTAEAVFALKHFAIARESYSMGLQWLHVIFSGNTDYLSRKIEVLAQSGQDSTALLQELLSNQNADGGWGSNKHYMSNAIDTSFALKALAVNGQMNPTVISKAIGYLKSKQNGDGGWGNEDGESNIEATVNVLRTFNQYKLSYLLDDSMASGIAWLSQRQNPDGGFGNSPSTVYDTALAVLALNELNLSREAINRALNYILSLQSADGSWNGSPYQTALSVGAVWKATIDPDLSIKSDDITFSPSIVTTLPANVSINAMIRNLGKTEVPMAKVALYDGAISEAHKVSEQTLSFPGQTSVSASFSVMITDGREHRFYFVVDPENHVKESNESNNKAVKILYPGATYDFVIAQVLASPNPAYIFEDVIITSTITNSGTMDAYNVQVRYYVDEAGGPLDISTVTIDIPANSTVTRTITWRAVQAGDLLPISVHVDPFNLFDELSEVNNKGTTFLTVRSSTEPNLKVSYKDIIITPTPVRERGEANLSIPVKNDGFSSASNVEVRFYKGIPGADGVLLGIRTIPLLNAGEEKRVSLDWWDIRDSGERIIYIQVDPNNVIKEVREDDNTAFTSLKILSLPDFMVSTNSISFLPPAPKDGDIVSILVTVQNRGEQDASNVVVKAYEKGAVIGSQTIPSLGGLSQAIVSFSYDATGKSGPHQIEVVVDPDQSVLEQSKDNNRASRTFGVQNANLWLTEPYISPNGDGVKDSTQFFFSFETARSVKVAVVSKDGKAVRTFSGGEFENITAGNVTWDGLDDNGRVVSDGQYRMEVRDADGNTVGSLMVAVDNNRSPFTDAIGTKYLLNNNLTCMLPYTYLYWAPYWSDQSEWFSDESGFLLGIQYPNDNTPEYLTGLYNVSSDGKDVMRIIPWQWSKNIGYNDDEFRVEHFKLSPDTEQVAFILSKYEGPVPWGHFDMQLWTADRNGGKLRLLDSWEQGGYSGDEVRWSPDGKNIAYKANYGLWVAKPDGDGKIKIDPSGTAGWVGDFKWSPDGNRIAYSIKEDGNSVDRIRLADTNGNKEEVVTPFSIDIFDTKLEWFGDGKLTIFYPQYEYGIWLINVGENGNQIRISDKALYGSISPDQKYIAFLEPGDDSWSKWVLKVSDQTGRVLFHHESPSILGKTNEWFYHFGPFGNLNWSHDSNQFAFVDYVYEKVDECHFNGYLLILDMEEKRKRAFKLTQYDDQTNVCENTGPAIHSVNDLQWFPDNLFLIGQAGAIFVINGQSGEKTTLPVMGEFDRLSPLGRHIIYNRGVDSTSACYGKAGGHRDEYDLWAMSSLLNLTAELRVIKDRSSVILKGIAADLNFEGYQLGYADVKSPHLWNPIAPPSEVPVINDVFTTWVPPYEGTFYVRLTVRDKAGNVAWDHKRVSWGLSSSITNLYKSLDLFSPNGDGVKDAINLHYTVVEPIHLEFYVYDENDQLKRTISKDHPLPTSDFITWDGRDEASRVVADGKYKIKVFHYEFFVEVDNTPPDVDMALNPIHRGSEPKVDLLGHVFDERLKYWAIEYGEGENPRQWYEYEKGEDLLLKRDPNGNPILPIQDVVLETYREDDLEWLVGKKLRITAEDFAGNRRTVVTDFLEEVFVLNRWDGRYVTETIPADLAKSGVHSIGGFETIRSPLLEIRLQHWTGGRWLDGPALTEPTAGSFRVEWDNSGLNPMEGFAVRMKALDLLGKEHYSNPLSTEQLFEIRESCDPMMPVRAENSLFEDLSTIRFQVRSDQDGRYYNWTEYQTWDRSKGDTIPVGVFIPPLPSIQSGMKYTLRMVGIGVSGKVYESGSAPHPPYCPVKITLKVDYPQAECGATSNRAILSSKAEGLSNRRVPQSLSYYIEKSGEPILLKQFDLTGEPWSGVLVDTRQIKEGSYPIHVLLSYLDLDENTIKEASASESLLIDRLLPAGQITYPAKPLRVCPITISDPKGNWFGIGVEGVASDNSGVKGYELFYGIGEDPVQWLPATSQSGGKSFPIAGSGALKGKIGVWDVTYLTGTSYSLMLKVVDMAGNTGCFTTHVSIDQSVNIPVLTTDKPLFSPNGDEIFDRLRVHYDINEYAKVDVKAFKLLKKEDGSYLLDSTPVRTITSGLQHPGGSEQTEWDGRDDANGVVPDGFYGIAVFATDSCGNTNMRWTPVEVDNTAPATTITYPGPGDPIGNLVEVKGIADDLHFESFNLEVGEGDSPDRWSFVSSGTNPVKNGILGRWDTFGLQGRWTLRLTATDLAGNRSVTTAGINLGIRKDLIKSLEAMPSLFSPNRDGKLDTVRIDYELTDLCEVKIEVFNRDNVLKKVYSTTHSGTNLYIWDGKDHSGGTVPDGIYKIRLSAILVSNPSLTHEEIISIGVDSTPPFIDIRQPSDLSFHRDEVWVNGTLRDENLFEYSITCAGDSGTSLLARGSINRENTTFGILRELPEGDYTLIVNVKDLAENITEKRVSFIIDRTHPKVNLEHPKEGEYYGSGKNIISVSGTIVEKNLEGYSLRVGSGESPAQWAELLTGHTIPTNPQLFSWKVGKDDGVADGLYTVSLFAKDKAGQTGEARVKVIVDHTPPETLITLPREGAFLRAPAEIRGIALDQNLEKYSLEISTGQCGSASNWNVIKTGITPVRDGLIGLLTPLPPDGDYCLRLAAGDRVGNRSETKVNIRIDTRSPSAPGLSGSIEERSNAKLTWTRNQEPDLAGYNLYRDGHKINSVLIKDIHYLDSNLKDGTYSYWVKAIDLAGNESDASNLIKLTVDLKAPEGRITSPRDGAIISGFVNIKGTAYSLDDFKQYRIFAGPGSNPATWTLIRTSPLATSSGTLAQWDTIGLSDGLYSIRLEAEDLSGNITTHRISVTVDNTPPLAPVLISAIPAGPDVTLTWRANTEPDLAGYLLFRNHQLVNASGIVPGDFKPYLIAGTTYLDQGVLDGTVRYYLLAMDRAGNMSDPSNSLELEIDTHSPRAKIVEPLDRSKFQDKTLVRAECSDIDISSIQFQYRKADESNWVNLGNSVTSTPYVALIDPISLGWVYGDYHLRAIARDRGGKADPSPSHITVTYVDLTPPSPPKDLCALTNGREVTLTWKANQEEDLSGYQIYRRTGSSRVKINIAPQMEATYQDRNLPDGTYAYEVTAVDQYDNESLPSNQVSVKIYAPYLIQPYTPTGQAAIEIKGWNASPSSSVEIFNETSSGLSSIKLNANIQGNFSYPALSLVLGENRISSRATDSAGNISRPSETVVVVYNEPPEPPAGLTFSVEGSDVHLSWNPSTESDLSGYNIYRGGKKLNEPLLQTSGDPNASFSDGVNLPSMAFDSDPWTHWTALLGDGYGGLNHVWWEVEFSSAELINRLEIEWGSGFDEQGNWTLYAGSSFEVQVWTGYAWITQATVNWNYSSSSILEFKPSYRTDKIRILITDSTDLNERKEARISEVRVFKDHLVSGTSFDDRDLMTGVHPYRITAVDYYGFESLSSEEVRAGVGDVAPPSPPQNLTASASGPDILLQWDANSESDLAGYNLYRSSSGGWIKINLSLINGRDYIERNLPNGIHTYRLTAVDTAGNESLPSNEAGATVDEEPPPSPVNLRIVSLPEGRTLHASWDVVGASSGFNLYRSDTPGGPYQKVNLSPILSPSYLDGGLINGKTYYYAVTAIDFLGNESRYSDEAASIPQDSLSPPRPEIFFPARPGTTMILTQDHSDILGTAEPGSWVVLFKEGIFLATTMAEERDAIKTFSLGYVDGNISISPDAKKVAYSSYGSLYLKNLATDTTTLIVPNGDSPLWSPDGAKLAYRYKDEFWNDRIGIYNPERGEISYLTGENGVIESSPFWVLDGTGIGFISNREGGDDVWVKELGSGSLIKTTHSGAVTLARLSPDGKRLAYFESSILYVMEVSSGSGLLIDIQADGHSFDWSPDSKKLAFSSLRNGNQDIYIFDVETEGQVQMTATSDDESNPIWSGDGQSIIFERSDRDGTISLRVVSADGSSRLIKDKMWSSTGLSRAKTGEIAFANLYELNLLALKGSFRFQDVALERGENRFFVIAEDDSKNRSDPSDEITVYFDAGSIPDLEVTDKDIFIHPPFPIAGEELTVRVAIKNRGGSVVQGVDAEIYLYDPSGNLELLKSETIPSLPPQSQQWITIPMETRSKKGIYEILVLIDPQDRIQELSGVNNFAGRSFFIAENEGVFMTTFVDSTRYCSGEDLSVDITLRNSGFSREVTLEAVIEDETGATVIAWEAIRTNLSYGSEKNYRLTWNTGSTYSGSYRIRTLLRGNPETIAEDISPFTILPDIDVDFTLITDKTGYQPHEPVSIGLNLKNNGRNYILPEMRVYIRIVNPSSQEVFREEREVRNLYPDTTVTLRHTWNTGLHPPGDYRVIAEALFEGQPITERSALFKIDALPILTGDIAVSPQVIFLGNSGRAEYSIRNEGNVDIAGLMMRVFIMDPETQSILSSREETLHLSRNSSWKGEFNFSTSGYSLKTYSVYLQHDYQGVQEILSKASFIVKDGKPPSVSILSPLPGHHYLYPATVPIVALTTDDGSGIERVEYQIDGGMWNLLPISDLSQGRYSAVWAPEPSDEGTHTVSIRASDRSGNVSPPVSVTFAIDLNLPPVANAGPDQNVITLKLVTLNGSESYDPEGAMITFLWRFLEVPPESGITDGSLSETTSPKPTFTPDADGTYRLQLTVNDGAFDSIPDEVVIQASTPNVAPNASAGPDQNVLTGSLVQLDGSMSKDPDNRPQPLTYLWSFVKKPAGSSLTDTDISNRNMACATFTPDVSGLYELRLTVYDGDLFSEDTVQIVATNPNVPPNANAGEDITINLGGTAILNGSASNDPDHYPQPLAYLWTFVSIPNGSKLNNEAISDPNSVSPSFTPDVAGTYVLQLMVFDGMDAGYDNVAVTVNVPQIPPTTHAVFSPAPNPSGWNKGDVTVTLKATDHSGAGIKEVTYSASGAQFIQSTTVKGDSIAITISAQGQTTLTFFARDNAGNIEAQKTVLVRIDKTAPAITCGANPNLLWPANHKMVNITVRVDISDSISGVNAFQLLSVVSNEPDNGVGDGDHPNDIQGWMVGSPCLNGLLRAERSGKGTGRIYTLTYRAMDHAGNSATCVTTVTVPHDNRK